MEAGCTSVRNKRVEKPELYSLSLRTVRFKDENKNRLCAQNSVNFEKVKRAGECFLTLKIPRSPPGFGLTRKRVRPSARRWRRGPALCEPATAAPHKSRDSTRR